MMCDPENDYHTEECIKGVEKCPSVIPPFFDKVNYCPKCGAFCTIGSASGVCYACGYRCTADDCQ